jgi:hypothetical protein
MQLLTIIDGRVHARHPLLLSSGLLMNNQQYLVVMVTNWHLQDGLCVASLSPPLDTTRPHVKQHHLGEPSCGT